MPDANAEMLAYYAARAPYYDAVYEIPERRNDIAFLKGRLPSEFEGRRLLEIACGTGYWTQQIAPKVARYVAIDAMPQPLDFARNRPGTENVEFVQADAYTLPSTLGELDSAFAGLWFSHVPIERRHEFLDHLHQLLTPGALVVFLDNSAVQCRELPITEQDAHGNTYQQRELRDGSVHRVLKNFPIERELKTLVFDVSASSTFTMRENFWLFEYVLKDAA